jgi:hypothetical protein
MSWGPPILGQSGRGVEHVELGGRLSSAGFAA